MQLSVWYPATHVHTTMSMPPYSSHSHKTTGLLVPFTITRQQASIPSTCSYPQATNLDVHSTVARPLVAPALVGISGTVFAYGVTSSGKTHTMMGGYSHGHGAEPGG